MSLCESGAFDMRGGGAGFCDAVRGLRIKAFKWQERRNVQSVVVNGAQYWRRRIFV